MRQTPTIRAAALTGFDALARSYGLDAAALLRAAGFSVSSRQWLPGRAPDRALFLAVMF